MPISAASRQISDDDLLYRKLNPEHWNKETDGVFPEAFIDKYDQQSFYVARLSRAEDLLERFAALPFARRLCGKDNPTARDLYDRGYGIATVPVSTPLTLGLHISEIGVDGHVNIVGARDYAVDFAQSATVLSPNELFDKPTL